MQKQRVRLLAAGIFAAALAGVLAGTGALAQTHGARPSKPAAGKPKPAGSAAGENPNEGERPPASASAPSASAAAGPANAAGEGGPVPAPAVEGSAGARLSPLNPAPNEFSDAGAPPSTIDYDRLLADIAALRARVAAVSDTLFHSRIAISLETSGDESRIAGLSVSLDDGVVWTSPASFRAEDATTIYDHAVAPGNHAVTVDVERRDRASDAFRTTQRSRFVVEVPAEQRLTLEVRLWDDSNMGDFTKDKQGRYELRVRARAKAEAIGR
jgi:hypothetical protein